MFAQALSLWKKQSAFAHATTHPRSHTQHWDKPPHWQVSTPFTPTLTTDTTLAGTLTRHTRTMLTDTWLWHK